MNLVLNIPKHGNRCLSTLNHILLPQLEKTRPQILKSWRIRIRNIDTCTNSLIIFLKGRALFFTSLNSLGMTNSMCEIRLDLFEITRGSLWSIFSTSLTLWSSNAICIASASSNLLLSRIIGDAWSTSLWFSKFHWTLDLLGFSQRPLTFDHINLASLLKLWNMLLRISNIWLTFSDRLPKVSESRLWYGLNMMDFWALCKKWFFIFYFWWGWGERLLGTSVGGTLFFWLVGWVVLGAMDFAIGIFFIFY